jgi:hypothetical protein
MKGKRGRKRFFGPLGMGQAKVQVFWVIRDSKKIEERDGKNGRCRR